MTQEDFAIMAADALVKNGVDSTKLSLDRARYALVTKDDLGRPQNTVYLANFYDRYVSAGDNDALQSRIIEQIIGLTGNLEFPDNFEQAKSHLRIQVKEKWYFIDDKYSRIDFGEHFSATLAYDMDENILYVDNDVLEMWNVSFDDAFSIAHRQLADNTVFEFSTYRSARDKNDCCHFFTASDPYSSARAVFTGVLNDLQVLGDRLVVVPHRDHLFITGSKCQFGLSHTLSAINELKDAPGALPPILLNLVDEYYYPYQLPKDHPLHADYRLLELNYLNTLYGAQKAELDSQFEQLSGNRFVSDHKIATSGRVPFSTCLIAEDQIPCLIPKVDYIIFGDSEQQCQAVCSWSQAQHILGGDQFIALDCYPKRFEVVQYPIDTQLEEMGFEPFPE